MKRVLGPAVLILATVAAGAALASGTAKTRFTARYSGTVAVAVNGDSVTATPTGDGKGRLVGRSTLTGTVSGTTANPPCSPLAGRSLISGAKSTLKLSPVKGSHACAAGRDDPNNVSFSGSVRVTRGTGELKKARGTLHFSGHYHHDTGAFTVKLTGTLSH